MKNQKTLKKFKLKGRAVAFIDWANVYGWEKSLKYEIEAVKIYEYLRSYQEIEDIRLYFGTDTHEKSKEFLGKAAVIGFSVITKPVKYILITEIEKQKIYRRKCDFDMESCIDAHRFLKEGFESFIFFTGDGDYEPLYKLLIELHKQVIVVYTKGHLGREIWGIKKGLFKAQLKNLMDV